jgi:hypothetical protein
MWSVLIVVLKKIKSVFGILTKNMQETGLSDSKYLEKNMQFTLTA